MILCDPHLYQSCQIPLKNILLQPHFLPMADWMILMFNFSSFFSLPLCIFFMCYLTKKNSSRFRFEVSSELQVIIPFFHVYCLCLLIFLKSLPAINQLQEARQKIEDMNKEQDSLIDIFSEERDRRDIEEENLRKKLRVSFLLNLCHFLSHFEVEIFINLENHHYRKHLIPSKSCLRGWGCWRRWRPLMANQNVAKGFICNRDF